MRTPTKKLMKKYKLNKTRMYELLEKAFYYYCSERDLELYLSRNIPYKKGVRRKLKV